MEYVKAVWSGHVEDKAFEAQSLNAMGFSSLHFAELLYQIAKHESVPLERVLHFLRVGIPGGGDRAIPTLIERISILAEQFGEVERIKLINDGVVGDRKEIFPISRELDRVEIAVKMCKAIRALRGLEDHDAIEAEYGIVSVDPGWEPKS
jgi:hypothetical protein